LATELTRSHDRAKDAGIKHTDSVLQKDAAASDCHNPQPSANVWAVKVVLARLVQEAAKVCETLRAFVVGYGRSPHAENRSRKMANSNNEPAPLLGNIVISA